MKALYAVLLALVLGVGCGKPVAPQNLSQMRRDALTGEYSCNVLGSGKYETLFFRGDGVVEWKGPSGLEMPFRYDVNSTNGEISIHFNDYRPFGMHCINHYKFEDRTGNIIEIASTFNDGNNKVRHEGLRRDFKTFVKLKVK